MNLAHVNEHAKMADAPKSPARRARGRSEGPSHNDNIVLGQRAVFVERVISAAGKFRHGEPLQVSWDTSNGTNDLRVIGVPPEQQDAFAQYVCRQFVPYVTSEFRTEMVTLGGIAADQDMVVFTADLDMAVAKIQGSAFTDASERVGVVLRRGSSSIGPYNKSRVWFAFWLLAFLFCTYKGLSHHSDDFERTMDRAVASARAALMPADK